MDEKDNSDNQYKMILKFFSVYCRKNGKEKKHKHSYWINIIYTINVRLLGHCICLKSSTNVFWVIQWFSTCCVLPVPAHTLNLWRQWNFHYLMNQNISALRTLGYVLNPGSMREIAIAHLSAGHHAAFYNTVR